MWTKTFLMVTALVMISASCLAAPWATCNPVSDAEVTSYTMVLNNVTYENLAPRQVQAGKVIWFDLAGKWQPGENEIAGTWNNMWGSSTPALLRFTAQVPGSPDGLCNTATDPWGEN
jgi:hypothetical protein